MFRQCLFPRCLQHMRCRYVVSTPARCNRRRWHIQESLIKSSIAKKIEAYTGNVENPPSVPDLSNKIMTIYDNIMTSIWLPSIIHQIWLSYPPCCTTTLTTSLVTMSHHGYQPTPFRISKCSFNCADPRVPQIVAVAWQNNWHLLAKTTSHVFIDFH